MLLRCSVIKKALMVQRKLALYVDGHCLIAELLTRPRIRARARLFFGKGGAHHVLAEMLGISLWYPGFVRPLFSSIQEAPNRNADGAVHVVSHSGRGMSNGADNVAFEISAHEKTTRNREAGSAG